MERLADRFHSSGHDVASLCRTLLVSNEFYSDRARWSLVRSPVEYVVGAVRALEARVDCKRLAEATAGMGQSLFEPPDVKGWRAGKAWVHASALLARYGFAAELARGSFGEGPDVRGLGKRYGWSGVPEIVAGLRDLLFQGSLPAPISARLDTYALAAESEPEEDRLRTTLTALLSLPEYQLG